MIGGRNSPKEPLTTTNNPALVYDARGEYVLRLQRPASEPSVVANRLRSGSRSPARCETSDEFRNARAESVE